MRNHVLSTGILYLKSYLTNGGDWSQDVSTIAHKGVFVSKTLSTQINYMYMFTCLISVTSTR